MKWITDRTFEDEDGDFLCYAQEEETIVFGWYIEVYCKNQRSDPKWMIQIGGKKVDEGKSLSIESARFDAKMATIRLIQKLMDDFGIVDKYLEEVHR